VLWHVLRAARETRPDRLIVVVGHGSKQVEEAVRSWGIDATFVHQGEALGTGHAVMVAEKAFGTAHDVLVLPGDEPLVTGRQLRDLMGRHRRQDVAALVQTTIAADPRGFGRVVRSDNDLVRITEGDEATAEELQIAEVATAVYTFRRKDLSGALPLLSRETRQGEYYLHHVIPILLGKGERVRVQRVDNGGAVGANSRAELARTAAVLRRRVNEELMEAGVTLLDPERTYVDVGVRVGSDTMILPGVHLEGETRIGRGCRIGPDSRIVDSRVDDGTEVTYSVVRGSRLGAGASVGPYASLRPGTVLGKGAKAGTFVEIKASTIGDGSKVPHLAYVGDAEIGRDVNVGAGTITCNYDGYEKHRTLIGDGAFIGSDTMLVAPVRIGRGAVTGAGSTITRDVPDGALAVERAEQRNAEGYAERRRRRARSRREKA
jgi:bifunctional UDP-N-acetylglucosamine pyrophosphorylase/glucosamine-1-phosphate N-acetyltransferase